MIPHFHGIGRRHISQNQYGMSSADICSWLIMLSPEMDKEVTLVQKKVHRGKVEWTWTISLCGV